MTSGGKDKKKLQALAVLGVILAVVMYFNLFSGSSAPTPERPATVAKTAAPSGASIGIEGEGSRPTRPKVVRRGDEGLHPVWWPNRIEDRPDLSKIDPTLLLDRFAKVQEVDAAGGSRNLFAFGAPPPPRGVAALKGDEPHVAVAQAPPEPPVNRPVDPATLPVHSNLKYYGVVALSAGGQRTACFLDTGDEILLATEGETLKRRFRVMKVGPSSVVLQDTESKREETLQLAKEAQERS